MRIDKTVVTVEYIKGTVSPYKRIFSNGSRMGIPIIQSSTWAMWFCDVATRTCDTYLRSARAWPAELALRRPAPASGRVLWCYLAKSTSRVY